MADRARADRAQDDRVRQRALELAVAGRDDSIAALAALVQTPSLTGEEAQGQARLRGMLEDIGADIILAEPDLAAMFDRFPEIAQYPTHWQHDLILPYAERPTLAALQASGLETVLNYRGRPNLVGLLRGTGGGRSLILNGHVDTVTVEPLGEWTRDPFGAEIEDGLMYGRGTSDMKGGVMAALMALTYLHRAGARLRGDVVFQSVVNEEHSGNGTLDLVCRGISADAAIVLEPTRNTLAVSHPGGLYWQIDVPGRPRSPGSRWHDGEQVGVSAIEKLPAVVAALLALEQRYNATVAPDPLENGRSPFSVVIGKVAGGHYETVTASQATLRGGAYFAPAAGSVIEVMQAFRDAVAEANAADPFLSDHPAQLSFLHHDDSTSQRPDIAIAALMQERLAARGGDSRIHAGPFCCDMRHLVNQGGIPSVIFGPGTIAQAHKPDEHIDLGEYLASIGHLIDIIWEWCNRDADPA